MTTVNKKEVAIAILHRGAQFLLQLRDDLPNILYPGHWTLFGGHLELGETADLAIQRELQEEINHVPEQLTCYERYEDERVIRHVYVGELAVPLGQLHLGEGQDMAFATLDDIIRGDRYSAKTKRIHAIGTPHQRILLGYIQARESINSKALRESLL
jgi:8-oxo-dGTP pyrophosphatase MutT (NUDIX family)